jgi:hypothetical protein
MWVRTLMRAQHVTLSLPNLQVAALVIEVNGPELG